MQRSNELGQAIGFALEDWNGAEEPNRDTILGRRCRLEALDADRHAEALHEAYVADRDGANWTYLPYGPFANASDYQGFLRVMLGLDDTLFFAVIDSVKETPIGVASYLRAAPAMGAIEVGHLSHAPALQKTPTSTEAMFLMMKRVFEDWGYRRYEWKCDSLNGPSRAAAQRLGFRFEGLFRQHVVFKGRNRDTAWFSMTDGEWPAIRDALASWLEPSNFDAKDAQKARLGDWMPQSAGQGIVSETDSGGTI